MLRESRKARTSASGVRSWLGCSAVVAALALPAVSLAGPTPGVQRLWRAFPLDSPVQRTTPAAARTRSTPIAPRTHAPATGRDATPRHAPPPPEAPVATGSGLGSGANWGIAAAAATALLAILLFTVRRRSDAPAHRRARRQRGPAAAPATRDDDASSVPATPPGGRRVQQGDALPDETDAPPNGAAELAVERISDYGRFGSAAPERPLASEPVPNAAAHDGVEAALARLAGELDRARPQHYAVSVAALRIARGDPADVREPATAFVRRAVEAAEVVVDERRRLLLLILPGVAHRRASAVAAELCESLGADAEGSIGTAGVPTVASYPRDATTAEALIDRCCGSSPGAVERDGAR